MRLCCAVIVTYNPDTSILEKTILSTLDQVDKIYVVDNASSISLKEIISDYARVESVNLDTNMGIAAGFNIGIQRAQEGGYSYLLLLDQDSIPPANMVMRYLMAIERLRLEGQTVAAVGPRYRDPRSGKVSSFVRFKWLRNTYISGDDTSSLVPTDFLISSGSFYPLEAFETVGLFDERLFIDHVDTEWCHRAASFGFNFFGIPDVIMTHSLGEGSVRLWFLPSRAQPLHKPFRLYYMVRNSLLMYRMRHVPLKWISGDVLRLVRLLIMYTIFSLERIESIRWFFRGFSDGLRNVVGVAPKY